MSRIKHTQELDHVVDYREEDIHKRSLFCRCNPTFVRDKNMVLHHELVQKSNETSKILNVSLKKKKDDVSPIKQYRKAHDEIDEVYKKSVEDILEKLKHEQKLCKHKKTEYVPDASGNNDSWYECQDCGVNLSYWNMKRMGLVK